MAAADEAGDGHQGARQRGGRGDISMRIHVGRVEARSISTLAIVPFFFSRTICLVELPGG